MVTLLTNVKESQRMGFNRLIAEHGPAKFLIILKNREIWK